MTLRTRLTELTGVRYPIVQTGMGYVSGARLTAATAAAGGLGIIASSTMSMAELASAIHHVKERTDAPFGVNIRSDAADAGDRVGLLIREQVAVASFALAPKRELIARLKDAGIITIPSIGARRHAEKVAEWGADAVVVQGGEGGGHTGAVPTTVLLPRLLTRWTSRSSPRAASSTAADWSPRWRTVPKGSPWEPGSCSPRRALSAKR